jgi:hypothetical protein
MYNTLDSAITAVLTFQQLAAMSEDAGEGDMDNSALATTPAPGGMNNVNVIGEPNLVRREEIRDGYGDIGALPTCGGSLVKAYAHGDPIFAPVRKMSVELLTEIFVQCVQLELKEPHGRNVQRVRAPIGHVCCA